MIKRPIVWGLLISLIGLLGWWASVILSIVTLGKIQKLANFFGILMITGLPVAVVWELARYVRRRWRRVSSKI